MLLRHSGGFRWAVPLDPLANYRSNRTEYRIDRIEVVRRRRRRRHRRRGRPTSKTAELMAERASTSKTPELTAERTFGRIERPADESIDRIDRTDRTKKLSIESIEGRPGRPASRPNVL